MRKLLILIFILVMQCSTVYAVDDILIDSKSTFGIDETVDVVVITDEGVRVWQVWSNRIITRPTCVLAPGGEYVVTKEFAPFLQVVILDGYKSNQKGFVWYERISNNTIIKQGVTFRTQPHKSKKFEDGVLFKGTKVKIIGRHVNRYRIKSNKEFAPFDFGEVWVWAERCKKK